MSDRQLALSAIAAATLVLPSPAAQAYTLFQDSQTSANSIYEKTWTSPLKATVELSTLLSNMTGNLSASIWIDGTRVTSGNYELTNPNNPGRLEIASTFDVNVGSQIRFRVEPQGSFNFDNKIELFDEVGLVFIGEKDRPFSHVGLNWNGQVYESSAPYSQGQYWDAIAKDYRPIAPDNGVQKQHSLGSFLHSSSDPNTSPVQNREYVRIPDPFQKGFGETMKNFVETQLEKTYAYSSGSNAFLNPYQQKCYYGKCTGVGLIERAAESSKFNGGQGFIPNYLEWIKVDNQFWGPRLNATPWECLITFPMTPECRAYADRDPNSSTVISLLSPAYQYYFLQKINAEYQDWLQGWFQNIDFMLTDPQGNKLSYRNGVWAQTGIIPDVFYTATGSDRHFFIPQRLAGKYSLEFFGEGLCNPNAIAVMGDNKEGMLVSGCVQPPTPTPTPTPTPGQSIPEPSTVLGIAMLGMLELIKKKIPQKD